MARMREDLLGATSEYGIACGSDLDRDGTCGDFFIMLWQPGSDATTTDDVLLIDSDNDSSLADESPMQDFSIDRDIGRFGHDNPATPIRESVPFVVQPEAAPISGLFWVNIGIVAGAHGSHVAGITAGNSLFGGQMSGAAPGAKIVSVRACLFTAGCTSHALIEGMIFVIEQANVDVVNMSIGGLPALNVDDATNTRAVLYNRLIEDNDVQMFLSAGNNGPGENTIGDPAVATKAMAVGAYIHKETWQKNYGSDSTAVDNLHPFSSAGRARTVRSSRRSSRPARRSRACRPGRSASRSRACTRFRPVTACSTARRWPLLRARAQLRC